MDMEKRSRKGMEPVEAAASYCILQALPGFIILKKFTGKIVFR